MRGLYDRSDGVFLGGIRSTGFAFLEGSEEIDAALCPAITISILASRWAVFPKISIALHAWP